MTPALLGIVGAALLLRILTLGQQSLWADEGFTAQIATGPLSDVVSAVRHTESTPPLYYLLEWLWVSVAGHGEVALRLPSALLGTATVIPAYAVATRLGSRVAGTAAAAVTAVSPFMIWYSQEARAYALLAFLSALGLWCFLRALSDDGGWAFAGWGLCSVLSLTTHYFAIFGVVAEAGWLLATCPRHRISALISSLAAGAAFAALLPLLSYQRDHVARPWTSTFSLRDQVLATGQEFVGGHMWTQVIHRFLIPVLALTLVALLAAGVRARIRVVRNPIAVVGAFSLGAPIVIGLLGHNYLAPRNVIGAWPVAAVLIGLAVGALGSVGRWTIALVCVAFLGIAVAVPADRTLQRDDWRGLLERIPRSEPLVVADARTDAPVVRYYRGDAKRCASAAHGALRTVTLVGHAAAVQRAAQLSSATFKPVSSRANQHLVAERLAAINASTSTCFPAPGTITLLPSRSGG